MRATKSVSLLTSMSTPMSTTGVDVAGHEALACIAAGLLGGRGDAAFAEEDDSLLDVAIRLLECALAIHHAGACSLAELLY